MRYHFIPTRLVIFKAMKSNKCQQEHEEMEVSYTAVVEM